ncbi:hypothetical protein HYU10_03495 [Candidatus Woesearchaeota archaeon]|nr:hypothetical protein [Candidatus Woesearchaeota archaeon]
MANTSNTYEDLIDTLNYQELMRLKTDIDSGGMNTKRLLEEKIKRRLREHEKSCATCSNFLNFYGQSNYTLLLGPDDAKKKASFCGIDCLEYFIIKMKEASSSKAAEKIDTQSDSINRNV